MKNCGIFFFIFFSFISACKSEFADKEELLAYVKDYEHGLRKHIERGNVAIDVLYKPKDLIIEQEIEDRKMTKKEIDSIREKLKSIDYFTFKLTKQGRDIVNSYVSNPSEFEHALTYVSSQIGNDVRLVAQSDTLSPQDFIYFRGYDINGVSEILFAFESNLTQRNGKAQFQFLDRFFQTGYHTVEFDIDDIKSIPSLTLKY